MKRPFPALLVRLWMISLLFGLVASLVGIAAGQTQSTATKPKAATAYRLIAVKVTGSNRFRQDEVAAASGLPVGTVAHEDDFRKAARQLGESGAFSDISFTYSFSDAGTKLEFKVADADKFVPARFTDFVWFKDEELRQKVHERIPLFSGELPTSGRLPDEVSDVLQALLVENGVPGHVEYQRKTDKSEHLAAIDYSVAGVSIRIHQLEFPGAEADELAQLQAAGGKLIDREYSREFLDSFIERTLLPVLHERGYLKAACAAPQPKVVKPSEPQSNGGPPSTLVDVAFAVAPGMEYKLGGVEWSGNKEVSTEALQSFLHVRVGQRADLVQLEDDLNAVRELYGSRGYILTKIRVDAQFDDTAGTVGLHLGVDEGSVYHMGELQFRGIDNGLTARLRAAWKIRPGDVYDAGYLKQFLPQAQKLLPTRLDWEVEPHVTAITRDKTVDVDLLYTAKAPQ